jgi:glycolate oxidase FAD binding subunit
VIGTVQFVNLPRMWRQTGAGNMANRLIAAGCGDDMAAQRYQHSCPEGNNSIAFFTQTLISPNQDIPLKKALSPGSEAMRLLPTTEAEVAQAVLDAAATRTPLVIEGGGTRSGLGRPVQTARTVSMSKLSGITLYEPAEMVIGAWAGTPLSTVMKTLDDRGQMLAFEPMDHRKLYGTSGEPTIGAVAACNISGPRRVMAGACRDSLIGVRFVNGRGETIKNGGRVMKNVTGLDLVKLQAGAHGTLGVLTEVIFKVQPKPATVATLEITGLSDAAGIASLCAAMGSPFEPTAAAHLPAGISGTKARSLIRIEGFPEQITYRSAALAKLMSAFGPLVHVPDALSGILWQDIRDAAFLLEPHTNAVWRLSVAPGKAAETVATIARQRAVKVFYDWSGGLIWLATAQADQAGSTVIQQAAAAAGGHATLVRADDGLRAVVGVFQPQSPVLQKLQAGIKAGFDPEGLINPGRMVAGF